MAVASKSRPLAGPMLFRKMRNADPTSVAVLILVAGMLGLFLLYPIGSMVLHSLVRSGDELQLGNLTLSNFSRFFTSPLYRRATVNSLYISILTTAAALAIGIPMALIMNRIAIPFKLFLTSLATLPLILPPFVGSYSWVLLLGRSGVVNYLLEQWFGWRLPDIYGPGGMILAMACSYYPFVFLMTLAGLAAADPFLEESASVMGAGAFRRLRTVVLPLVLPSVGAGAVTVFMRTIGNFGVPAILGGEYYVLPTLAYFQVVGYFNLNTASAIAMVNALFSVAAILLLRYLTARGDYVTIYTQARAPRLVTHPVARALGLAYVVLVLVVSLAPHLTVVVGSLATRWAGTPFPTAWGLDNYRRAFVHARQSIIVSIWLATLSTVLCVVIGTVLSYVATKRRLWGRWLLDVTVTLPFLLPGIVVGVAMLSAFATPPLLLAGTWAILVVSYFVRRMPYVFRSGVAAFSQVHQEMEEASQVAGAPWAYTFRKVMLPLVAPGVLSGALISFSTLIGELSTTIIVFSPRYKPITVAIYEYVISDTLGPAFALGTVLLAVVLASILLANRIAGQRVFAMFSGG